MNECLLSICLPTFNRYEQIKKQLDFVLEEAKEFRNIVEVVVSNNASTDATNAYLEEKSKASMFIYNSNANNVGLVKNLFTMTHIAKGEYIWFIGDDDVIVQGTLKKIISCLIQFSNIGAIFLNHSLIRGDKICLDMLYRGQGGAFHNGSEKLIETFFDIYGGFMFITANIIKKSAILDLEVNLPEDCSYLLATPILLPFISVKNSSFYIFNEVFVQDQLDGTSWGDKQNTVFNRYIPKALSNLDKFGYDPEEIEYILNQYCSNRLNSVISYFLKHPIKGRVDYLWYLKYLTQKTVTETLTFPYKFIIKRFFS